MKNRFLDKLLLNNKNQGPEKKEKKKMVVNDNEDDFNYNPDDYDIIKRLGAGVFGETFLAKDKRSGNKVVIKRLPKEKLVEVIVSTEDENGKVVEKKTIEKTGTSKEMFEEEVDNLKLMKPTCTPNVLCYVGVSDKNEDPTVPYRILVTEYLDHYMLLEDYIKNTPDEERWSGIRPLFANLVLGLQDFHRAGEAHRDIKPTNLMINPSRGLAAPLTPAKKARMGREMEMEGAYGGYDDFDDNGEYYNGDYYYDSVGDRGSALEEYDKGMHIKYIDLGLSCTRKKCNDFAGTPLYLIPEIKFPKSGLNEAAAKLNVSTVPINFDTYVMADYWALGITMIEYILGEDYFVELLDKRGIEPKDMIRYLLDLFRNIQML
jgi:serine/threonine protein kinase